MHTCREKSCNGVTPGTKVYQCFKPEILKLLRRVTSLTCPKSHSEQSTKEQTNGEIFKTISTSNVTILAILACHLPILRITWLANANRYEYLCFQTHTYCCIADVWIAAPKVCAVSPPSLTQHSCYLFSAWVSKCSTKAKTQRRMSTSQVFLHKPYFLFEFSSTVCFILD